jgi:alanyl-tRNA synthetase
MLRKLEALEMKQAAQLKKELSGKVISVGKYFFVGEVCEGVSPEALRKIAAEWKTESPAIFISLAVISEGRPFVVIGIGDRLASEKNLDAAKLIRELVAPAIKGGGGGQKTLASAGGQDANALASIMTDMKGVI